MSDDLTRPALCIIMSDTNTVRWLVLRALQTAQCTGVSYVSKGEMLSLSRHSSEKAFAQARYIFLATEAQFSNVSMALTNLPVDLYRD